jgi:hypothetical protein
MIELSAMSRQPHNLGMSIDRSTHSTYASALNLYITFCCLYKFNMDPTLHTLALYATIQSTYINLKLVDTYLSGICNQIETHFPDVRW